MPQKTAYLDFADGARADAGRRAVLSAERYVSVDYMRREWQRMWTRTWLLAGLESDLAEPGDFLVFEIGPEFDHRRPDARGDPVGPVQRLPASR